MAKDRIPKRKASSFIKAGDADSQDAADYLKNYENSHASSGSESRDDLEYGALSRIRDIAQNIPYYNDNNVRHHISSATDKQLRILNRISADEYLRLGSKAGYLYVRDDDSGIWLLYH